MNHLLGLGLISVPTFPVFGRWRDDDFVCVWGVYKVRIVHFFALEFMMSLLIYVRSNVVVELWEQRAFFYYSNIIAEEKKHLIRFEEMEGYFEVLITFICASIYPSINAIVVMSRREKYELNRKQTSTARVRQVATLNMTINCPSWTQRVRICVEGGARVRATKRMTIECAHTQPDQVYCRSSCAAMLSRMSSIGFYASSATHTTFHILTFISIYFCWWRMRASEQSQETGHIQAIAGPINDSFLLLIATTRQKDVQWYINQ